MRKFDNGFIMEDTHMGPPGGKVANSGNKVAVRYRGSLAKGGKVFDETKGGKTFQFRLGKYSYQTLLLFCNLWASMFGYTCRTLPANSVLS